ncbi:MAG: 4Fe-4S dicluster domain-containing protein [Rhodospirillales bacterium]|nr:4Fe-4S dicluster domain-containing protein [Rhodospirillales bacterium]
MIDFNAITALITPHGLAVRGGFHPGPDEGLPGQPATVVLIGHLGRAMWPAFQRARLEESHPLDRWAKRIIDGLALELEATALYPFQGPPYWPFQRWAMRAEGLVQSPIGPLIHPIYGLWHGYCGALAFSQRLDLPAIVPSDPCAACADKPCLTACPVSALAPGRYDVPACVAHLRTDGNDCLEGGCLARHACPIGRAHAYVPDEGGFHTRAFLKAMD